MLIARDFAAAFERLRLHPHPDRAVGRLRHRREGGRPGGNVSKRRVHRARRPRRAAAVSVPAGLSDGLPLGLQIIGRAFDEETVLRVGQVLEEAAAFTHLPSFIAG